MSDPREERVLEAILKELRDGFHHQKCLADIIEDGFEAVVSKLEAIRKELSPQRLTQSIAVQFTGDILMADNVLVLNVGQTSQASIQPFLADGVTPSGGTLSAVSYTFSDPSATVVLNPDGLTATVTGVADSAGAAISGSASCTVTDTDGVVSTWTQKFTITTAGVAPPPPSQLTQSVAVQFSAPVSAASSSLKAAAAPVKDHRL